MHAEEGLLQEGERTSRGCGYERVHCETVYLHRTLPVHHHVPRHVVGKFLFLLLPRKS